MIVRLLLKLIENDLNKCGKDRVVLKETQV